MSKPDNTRGQQMSGGLKGKHVLLAMLGFFAVIFVVNGVFTYFALSTFTGVSANDAYRRGRDYNQTIEAAERQKELGWNVQVEHRFVADGAFELSIRPRDKDGALMTGLVIEARMARPTQADLDRTISVRETEAGLYRGSVDLPSKGLWDLELRAGRGSGTDFISHNRIVVD